MPPSRALIRGIHSSNVSQYNLQSVRFCQHNDRQVVGDNDQATRWAVHGMVTTANKSVRMNYHWVQEAVEDGFVDMRRVPTADNTSDIFTKTLGEVDITRLRPGLTGYGPLPPVPDAMPT